MAKYKQSIIRFAVTVFSVMTLVFSFSPMAIAAEYNCGTYGAGQYDEGGACATTSDPGDGGLVDTGQRVLAFGIPAAMIIAGTVLLFRTNRKRKSHSDLPPTTHHQQ